jgi:nucleolar protein 53
MLTWLWAARPQVVPCAMLTADRFKSLQQRGILEPRKPQPLKQKR